MITNHRITVATVVGARPQFIKAAVVSRAMRLRGGIREIIVHTGQHYDRSMSDIFFDEMDIPRPDYNLGINSLQHGAMTGRMLESIEEVLMKENPDIVLVYGDTNSTLAAALAARKLNRVLVHVEAGLRSFNMRMPEEVNRILTDRISDVLCCPTENAVQNLMHESFRDFPCTVVKTGDVMLDAARYYEKAASERSRVMQDLDLRDRDFLLCTLHRAENTDDPVRLGAILSALNEIARDHVIVFPIHPRTRKVMVQLGIAPAFPLIDPVGYFDMTQLLRHARLVMTDSGGLQKEAFFFGKPCVTLRDETEWTELVQGGFNLLVGAERERILDGFQKMLLRRPDFNQDLYGVGKAGARIAELIGTVPGSHTDRMWRGT